MRHNFFVNNKHAIISCVIILFFTLLLITIILPHDETDERIYQTLGVKLASFQQYTLQNTAILKYLPQKIYDTPLFFRPPAFAAYLAIWHMFLGNLGFRISPVIIYIILCLVLYKTVLHMTKSENSALKALVLSAVSSLLLYSSVQIHLDLFMTLMASLSFYFAVVFRESGKRRHVFFSGVFIALAVLTNYTAAILYPFFSLFMFYRLRGKYFVQYFFLFLFPSIMVLLWLYNVLAIYHMPALSLLSPPVREELTNHFISYVYHRTFYFYFLNIFITNPLYLFILVLLKRDVWNRLRFHYGKIMYFLLSIILTVLTSLTLYGVLGGTYQMRYILLSEPFLIILLSLIPFEEIRVLWNYFWFFSLYNLLLVIYNTGYGNSDLYSFFEMIARR